jgi:hypothetical protein
VFLTFRIWEGEFIQGGDPTGSGNGVCLYRMHKRVFVASCPSTVSFRTSACVNLTGFFIVSPLHVLQEGSRSTESRSRCVKVPHAQFLLLETTIKSCCDESTTAACYSEWLPPSRVAFPIYVCVEYDLAERWAFAVFPSL